MDQTAWWKPGLDLFARLSGLIVAPVIAAVFVGHWLDNKYHSEPWLFLASVGVAFFLSMFGLIRITLTEYKKIADKKDK